MKRLKTIAIIPALVAALLMMTSSCLVGRHGRSGRHSRTHVSKSNRGKARGHNRGKKKGHRKKRHKKKRH